MITSCCIKFKEYKNFPLFQEVQRLLDVAGVKIMSFAIGKADLFVWSLTKSKSKELI